LEIETAADPEYDNTGLLRIQKTDIDPLAGFTGAPPGNKNALALGVAWGKDGVNETLAQFWRGTVNATLTVIQDCCDSLKFEVKYQIRSKLVDSVTEVYEVSTRFVNVTATLQGKNAENMDWLHVVFPVFLFDGKTNSSTTHGDGVGNVVWKEFRQVYVINSPFLDFAFENKEVASRNGYLARFVAASENKTSISYSFFTN